MQQFGCHGMGQQVALGLGTERVFGRVHKERLRVLFLPGLDA